MENETIEQPVVEPETHSENNEGSIYGKFKDAETLLEAYNSLEAEFTRKSQKLSELQKKLEEKNDISNNDSIENVLNNITDSEKYKKEVMEILDKNQDLSNLPNKNQIAFKIIKEAERKTEEALNNQEFVEKYFDSNENIKQKVLSKYLSSLNETSSAPKVISGNASNIYISPSLNMPKTLKDAGEILSKMLK